MAEGFAVQIASAVVGKLGEIVVNEASLVLNFREDFNRLQRDFRYMSGYLRAADEHSALKASVKQWLSEVSDIALDAEDIVDECAVEPLYTRPTRSCLCRFSQLNFRRKMGRRIKELKGRMRSTIQKAQELNLVHQILHSSQPSTSTSGRERGTEVTGWNALEEDSRSVGVEEKVEEIMGLLEEPEIGVVSVVGMGGLGKTFLVKNVYDKVKGRYEHWITVSQNSSLRTLQSDLASNINLQINDRISDFRAAQLIHEKLEGKRCLIVLDDVWITSFDGNLTSRLGLPSGRNSQCKTVVTTRSRDVAAHMNASVYEMQHLTEEDSWKLFCLFAFPHCEGKMPPEHLDILARRIVEKCGGLPLAIKTVAASLASCLDLRDWDSKLKQLMDAQASAIQILKLSYDSLPPYLKASFAYFSFFPEDTHISFSSAKVDKSIHQEYLIYLWIAEGFIPQEKDREQFDIGLSYLQQLKNLCLLEVDRIGACYTIHDLLLELVNDIGKEHKSEFVLPVNKTSCRRLLLSKKGITTRAISTSSLHCQRFLRTISFSQNPEITSIPKGQFARLRELRVLDLSSTAIPTLPKCVGKLKLLKFLNLSETKIAEVPGCVRRLKCLQYLDVSGCTSLQRVPDWIADLKCLSYLDVSSCSEELHTYMPKGMAKLSSLRTLRSEVFPLSSEDTELLNVQDVGNLVNLQEISFILKDEGALRSVEDGALERMVKMRILEVRNEIPAREGDTEESNLPAFPQKMSVMTDLRQLRLVRFSMPSWICGMVNLTELGLCKCSGYPSLQNMPNLESLMLIDDSRSRELPEKFGEGGAFPKLASLTVKDFPLLEEVPVLEEGAMQRLEVLAIRNCPRVKKIPEGLERLRRLKSIMVEQPSNELKERLKEGGEDWNKIKLKNSNIEIFVDE